MDTRKEEFQRNPDKINSRGVNDVQDKLDKIKLSRDETLEKFKRYEIVKNSGLIVNGSMGIIGGTGTGKTSLITKITRLYMDECKGDLHVLYFGGEIDQTFSKNISSGVILIKPIDMKTFLEKYSQLKKQLIEWIEIKKMAKVSSRNSKESSWNSKDGNIVIKKQLYFKDLNTNMVEIARKLKITDVDDLVELAIKDVEKYSLPSEVAGVKIPPLVVNGEIVPTLSIFDDITQLGKFTSDPTGKFLRMITANTRHFMNTSIFSMQRYTYLPSNVRKNVNSWMFAKPMPLMDLKILFSEINLPDETEPEEVIEEISKLQKYEFLVISGEFNVLRVLRT